METTENTRANSTGATKHQGKCHCGAVRFEAEIDLHAGASRCNCSICIRVAQTSSIVKPNAFVLLSSEDDLGRYEWGGRIARRFFCKQCGIHCFSRGHLPQLGGDFVSVNWNCLDDIDVTQVKVTYWDGRHDNWEAGTRSTPWPISLPPTAV